MRKWILRLSIATFLIGIATLAIGAWALQAPQFHKWIQVQIEDAASNSGFTIHSIWNFKRFPFGLSGTDLKIVAKSTPPGKSSPLQIGAKDFSFQYSVQLWPLAILIHEISVQDLKIFVDQSQKVVTKEVSTNSLEQANPETESLFQKLPQFPMKVVLEKLDIRNIEVEFKSQNGSLQFEKGSIHGKAQSQANLEKNIFESQTEFLIELGNLLVRPHLIKPIPLQLALNAHYFPLTGAIELKSTLNSANLELVRFHWNSLEHKETANSNKSRMELETFPALFQLPFASQYQAQIKNYGKWKSQLSVEFENNDFTSGKFDIFGTQFLTGSSLQVTPIKANGKFQLGSSLLVDTQISLESAKYLTQSLHSLKADLNLNHNAEQTKAKLTLSKGLYYESFEFTGPTQGELEILNQAKEASWKILLSLPFIQWNQSHAFGNALYEINAHQMTSTKTGSKYFNQVRIQSSLNDQGFQIGPKDKKISNSPVPMGIRFLIFGEVNLDEAMNLSFQNFQLQGFADPLSLSMERGKSNSPILNATLNGSKKDLDANIKGLLELNLKPENLKTLNLDANASIHIPLEIQFKNNPKTQVQHFGVKGELAVQDLNWIDSKKGFALVKAMGRLPFSEHLRISKGKIQWVNKTPLNPFLKVDFNRMSPLLVDSVDFKIEKIKYLEKSYGPIGFQMELSENLLKIYQVSALLNGADLAGEAIVDVETQRLYGLLRITGFNIEKNVPSSKMGKNLAGESPIHFRTGFLLDPSQRSLDGKIEITQIDGRQLTTAINILDPKYEDNSLNSLRTALRVAYPSSVSADINQGQLDAEILLAGALNQTLRINSVPVGKLLLKYWPPTTPSQETK